MAHHEWVDFEDDGQPEALTDGDSVLVNIGGDIYGPVPAATVDWWNMDDPVLQWCKVTPS